MNDSDSDPGIDLTGFLFGNIDESGQLENDVLDNESKRHLASLGRLGLNSFWDEFIPRNKVKKYKSESDSDDEGVLQEKEQTGDAQNHADYVADKDGNYDAKSPSAVDYSDIAELAEDDGSDIKEFHQPTNVAANVKNEDCTDYDADDEGTSMKSDTQLMPPPPLPSSDKDDDGAIIDAKNKRLETPLAAMLPSKYADVNVTEIFPDFRIDKVLRFSRLFGPGKPSSLPQIWRSVRKRRRRRKHLQPEHSDSGSDQDIQRERKVGWNLNLAPPPSSEKCHSDDEKKLLQPVEDKTQGAKLEQAENNDMGPKVADWRFGPAQVWYDMLEVPETGEGFNYGFKVKDELHEQSVGEDFSEDTYLMVSQLHWEDEVIWNGDDIKHRVMQKLNCKTNAAGWVPSSDNRTAQAFSQPGKGVPHIVGGTVRLANNQMANANAQTSKQAKTQIVQKMICQNVISTK